MLFRSGRVCEKIGLVKDWQEAKSMTPFQPFVAMVSRPMDYACVNGTFVKKEQIDFVSRLTFMQKMHQAYPVTGAVASGAAAKIEGSVVWTVLSKAAREREIVQIGHPSGVMPVEVSVDEERITKIGVYRTARVLLDGTAYIRKIRC